jgi:DNA invertase Pin-like site-specific DNA recombinase
MAKNLTGNAVAYIRVSTGKQAKSGLGLEAQTEAIRAFARSGPESAATALSRMSWTSSTR